MGALVGREHVMGGTTYITGAKVISPGVITHTGSIDRLVFGEYDGGVSLRGERFLDACKRARIDAHLSTNIAKEMWAKFALLSAFSGVSSMLRKPVGPIVSNPDTCKLLRELALWRSCTFWRGIGRADTDAPGDLWCP
jgi:2-dehydropantoate 2-reductase